MEKKSSYWLVLFKPSAFPTSTCGQSAFIPATWDGVVKLVSSLYPQVYPDLLEHLQTLKETSVERFEQEAGFSFIDCLRNADSDSEVSTSSSYYGHEKYPPYYSYEKYCSLPTPRHPWQVRLFLYCEIRLLELFHGDGYASVARTGAVVARCLEYLCPNISISALDSQNSAVIPMRVSIPK